MDWPFFKEAELRCKCGCGGVDMQDSFMQRIVALRKKSPFKFRVTSAYRCPEYNNIVSSTGFTGPHTYGRAMDIAIINSKQRYWLIKNALLAGFKRVGIGKSFIHLDDLDESHSFDDEVTWLYGNSNS